MAYSMPTSPAPNSCMGKALIVDSSATLRRALMHIFSHWGEDIHEADSAEAALADLDLNQGTNHPYSIVITSDSLNYSGTLFAEHLLNHSDHGRLKIIYFSSNGSPRISAHPSLRQFSFPVSQAKLYQCLRGRTDIELPQASRAYAETEAVESDTAPNEDWSFHGAKLLVVDDNETNRALAAEILTMVGCECDWCEDGLRALEAVQAKDYDVVLMDIQMPVMDGLTAARAIRALGDKYTDLPIIAMTAHALTTDREKSFAAGMNAHVTKPIDTDVLFSTLSQWISSSPQIRPEADQQTALPEQDTIPNLPGIELKDSLERVRGNWTLLKNLLIDFGRIHKQAFEELSRYLSENDLEKAKSLSHTLKGSGANIGTIELSREAAAIEAACQENDQAKAITLLESFASAFRQAMNSIATLNTEEDESSDKPKGFNNSATIDTASIRQALKHIQDHLNTDLGLAQDGLKSLRKLCEEPTHAEKVTKLEVTFQTFDLELANDEIIQWLADISEE